MKMNMNTKIIMVVVVLFVAGVASFLWFQRVDTVKNTDVMVEETTKMTNPTEEMVEKDELEMAESTEEAMLKDDAVMMEKGGQYLPFTPEVMTANATNRRVLFFFANWCPTCKPADMSFTASQAQIPNDVTLIRVNYNDTETDSAEKALAEQYGVTYQHTFVQIDEAGNEVTKWNGGQIKELLTNII